MSFTRRSFLRQSLAVTSATMFGQRMLAQVPQAPGDTGGLVKRMAWFNEPASSSKSGHKLLVRSRSKTDFWRKTFYGYLTDNGHFFPLPTGRAFGFQAHVNGHYAALVHPPGLIV